MRLQKFSTEMVGDDKFVREVVYYNGKPFNGTIMKKVGIFCNTSIFYNSGDLLDAEYLSSFIIIFRNGQFNEDYYFKSNLIELRFYFDKNGNPDRNGYIIFKGAYNYGGFECDIRPLVFPNIIDIHPPRIIDVDDFGSLGALGTFNFLGNQNRVSLIPMSSISEFLRLYAYKNLDLTDCFIIDTIQFSFTANKLKELIFKDLCNTEIKFNSNLFIKDMPLFDAATNYGNDFIEIDYSRHLFSYSTGELFTSNYSYYLNTILSSGSGIFFDKLENVPTSCEIHTKDYWLKINFNKTNIIAQSKIVPTKDIFYQSQNIYKPPFYELQYDISSFQLRCKKKDNENYFTEEYEIDTKYTKKGDQFNLTSLAYKQLDTIAIQLNGDFKSNNIEYLSIRYINKIDPFDRLNYFKLKHKGMKNYIIEAEGILEYDGDNDKDIVKVIYEASKPSQLNSDEFRLIPNGKSSFFYSDNSKKVYEYKNGELIYK
ncbi:MAG: hypothetical protein IPL31_01995 [Saprospiraceae bacterium]|nr:hypothetical protein [Saprospiraceae bacterium]